MSAMNPQHSATPCPLDGGTDGIETRASTLWGLDKTPTTHASPAGPTPCGFEVDFLPLKALVGQMRQTTTAHLRAWGLEALAESATLVVSELITNAIQHGQGAINLTVKPQGHILRIEVADGSPAPARKRSASGTDEYGRGLEIVAALSRDWNVSSDGTTTWCTLALPAEKVSA